MSMIYTISPSRHTGWSDNGMPVSHRSYSWTLTIRCRYYLR